MKIVRNKPDRYLVADNRILRDTRISDRARGLLLRVLSYPDGWDIDSTWLAERTKEGRDAVRCAIRELEAAGYWSSERVQVPDPKRPGRLVWSTAVTVRAEPDGGFPADGNGLDTFTGDGFSGPCSSPTPEKPSSVQPAETANGDDPGAVTEAWISGRRRVRPSIEGRYEERSIDRRDSDLHLKKDLETEIVEGLRDVTGVTIPRTWVPNVLRALFDGDGTPPAHIKNPGAYARKAFANDPDPRGRFLPTPEPPRLVSPQPAEPREPAPPPQPVPNGTAADTTAPPVTPEEARAIRDAALERVRAARAAKATLATRAPLPAQPPPPPDGDDTARERARQEAQMAVYQQALADGLSLDEALKKARAHTDNGPPPTPPEGPKS